MMQRQYGEMVEAHQNRGKTGSKGFRWTMARFAAQLEEDIRRGARGCGVPICRYRHGSELRYDRRPHFRS
jgi:hypothetical protein